MNTYLKTTGTFPEGLNYLNISSINKLESLLTLGELTSLYRTDLSKTPFVSASKDWRYVNGTQTPEGYVFEGGQYIGTGLYEKEEFTWVVLYKVESTIADGGLDNVSPIVSNLLPSTNAPDRVSHGQQISVGNIAIKLKDGVMSNLSNFSYTSQKVADVWALTILSRKKDTNGGATYSYYRKLEGLDSTYKSVSTTELIVSEEVEITVGGSAAMVYPIETTVPLFASYDKGLSLDEVLSFAVDIQRELAEIGYNVN